MHSRNKLVITKGDEQMDQLRRKLSSWCLVVALFSVIINAEESIDVSYEELMALNASCAPYDTCAGGGANNVMNRHCKCGPECAVYNTCCVDSPYRGVSRMTESTRGQNEVCTKVFELRDYYFMVNECDPRWNGSSEVKTLCEQDYKEKDPFLVVPASSVQRKKTYKNYFCGLCNNVDSNELRLWDLGIKFRMNNRNSKPQEDVDRLTEQLVYEESIVKWGRWVDRDGKPYFDVVYLIPKAPPYLTEVSGSCIPNLVSGCSPSWKNETVRRKCASYLAPIYVLKNRRNFFKEGGSRIRYPNIQRERYQHASKVQYRNIHCALCNYVSQEDEISCKSTIFPTTMRPVMSFTLLLDVNPSDGIKVGLVDKCNAGQSYDPFFKKCRSLECGLPGFVIHKNKCVMST